MDNEECVGAIVCKLDRYKDANRGYIAMLDVDERYRRKKIGNLQINNSIKINILFQFIYFHKIKVQI
jgi:hypothetical protein